MTTSFRTTLAALACTFVMSATCVIAAVGPAQASHGLSPQSAARIIA